MTALENKGVIVHQVDGCVCDCYSPFVSYRTSKQASGFHCLMAGDTEPTDMVSNYSAAEFKEWAPEWKGKLMSPYHRPWNPVIGHHDHRDVNAAYNVAVVGLAELMGRPRPAVFVRQAAK